VLPPEVYEALVEAIPPHVFFDSDPARHELPAPPKVAPLDSVVVWGFVNDVMKDVFLPAMAARLDQRLVPQLARAQGTILIRRPGQRPRAREASWELVTSVVDLGPPGAEGDHGTLVRRRAGDEAEFRTPVTLAPNCALTFVNADAVYEYASPADRHTYEFRMGRGAR
jgi:hypothetical protein